jgi:hypothetical protein
MTPDIKGLLQIAASTERRSIGNMVEVMIVKYAQEIGIEVGQIGHPESRRLSKSTRKK